MTPTSRDTAAEGNADVGFMLPTRTTVTDVTEYFATPTDHL